MALANGLAWLALLIGTPTFLSAQSVSITEYPPIKYGSVFGILGPDGARWFIESSTNIGRMAPDGTLTLYPLSSFSSLSCMVKGPDGAMWFSDVNPTIANKVGKIDMTGAITEYPVPTPFIEGITTFGALAIGPDNAIWFTDTHKIGRMTTAGDITEFDLPSNVTASGLGVGPDGAFWFTDENGNTIGRITTAGAATIYPLAAGLKIPHGIVPGPDGALWFGENGKVGRITTTGTITEYPVSGGVTSSISTGPDGALWFTESLGKIGRITTAGVVTEFSVLTTAGAPGAIGMGPDGALWFTEFFGKIARVLLTYGSITVTTAPVLGTFTVDGVTYNGSVSFNWAVGETHSVGLPSPQPYPSDPGARYVFGGWSDGGAQTHNVTVSASTSALTATFTTQYRLILGDGVSANPPSSDGFYNSGTSVQLTATPPAGTTFVNWTGGTTSNSNPQAVAIGKASTVQANFSGPSLSVSLKEYALTNSPGISGIATAPDGAFWFTESSAQKIGRVTTLGVVTEYSIPLSNAYVSPEVIVYGQDDNLWFTEYNIPQLGTITLTGVFTELPIPAPANGIAVGPDHAIWFTESNGNIGRMDTAGMITEHPIPTFNSKPASIALGPDNALWFVEAGASQIGRITTAGVVTEYATALWTGSLGAIVSGPGNALWFIDGPNIGRITTAGIITEYATPGSALYLTNGSDGALWFCEASGKLGRITTAGVVTEYSILSSPGGPILTGPDGALWFIEGQGAKIGRALVTTGNVMVNTSPALLSFSVDGVAYTGAVAFNWAPGDSHSIAVASSQAGSAGTRYGFTSWSDGGAQTHNITVPSSPAVYTATLSPQCLLTTTVSPSNGGTVSVSPSSPDGYYNIGSTVQLTATPGTGFRFTNWSGDLSGAANPQSLAMNAPHQVQANFIGLTQSVNFSEYPVGPPSPMYPLSLTAGPDGALWFTQMNTGNVGRITTAGVITQYSTSASLGTSAITTGPDGALWFTENTLANKIGRITTAGAVTEYPLPSNFSGTEGIAQGPDGALWFTEYQANQIGRITTAGAITGYPLPTAGAFPGSIVLGPDGALWFVENQANQVGRITTTALITEYAIPTVAAKPGSIAVGPDGALWFTESAKIGRITTAGVITEYPVATGSSPGGLTTGPDGALWFTEFATDKIGRMTTAGVITEYQVPTSGPGGPQGIAIGPDGALWFTEYSNQIGRVVLPTNACTYSLGQASQSLPSGGGAGTIVVRAPAGGPGGCPWTATSSVPWVTIASPGSGAGNGTVSYTVAANSSTLLRSGVLTIANQPYVVTQSGTAAGLNCTGTVPGTSLTQAALEGRTELLADYLLNCTGLSAPLSADIILTLNTNVTNQLTNLATDAVVTVNGGTPQNGVPAGYNSLRWSALSIVPAADGTAKLRISKVRADASLLLLQGAVSNPGNPQALAITGQVTVDAAVAVPVSGALQVMANAGPTMAFSSRQAAAASGGGVTLPVIFQEAAADSYQVGTRLRVALNNLPAYAQVYAPVYPAGSAEAQLYSADASGLGGSPLAGSSLEGNAYQQLTVTAGAAAATWVVTSTDPSQVETLTFPLLVLNATAADLTGVQVWGTLAPVSDVAISSATAPVPRYRDLSAPQALANLRVGTSVQVVGLAGAPATPGSNVVFTTQVVNDVADSAQTATNVRIRDILPIGLNPAGCTATGSAGCTTTGRQVQANVGTLGPLQGATLTVTAQVDPSFTGAAIENPESASSDQVNLDLAASTSSSSFTVLTGTPAVLGDTPSSGYGMSGSVVFQFSHPVGYQNLSVVNVLINSALDGRHACYLAYSVPSSTLYLVDDAGDAGGPYAGSVVLGSSSAVQNSQCMVHLTSAVGDGATLTLTLNIAFQSTFRGCMVTYLAARDQGLGNSGWQALGVWQVPEPLSQLVVSTLLPTRGATPAGTAQTFTFALIDTKGTSDVGVVNVLVNSAIDGRQACYLAYAFSTNTLYLVDDTGDAGGPFAGSMPLNGASGAIQNSQCVVSSATASSAPGATLVLTLGLAFKSSFAGNRILYIAGRDRADGNNTGWQAMGTWTIQ